MTVSRPLALLLSLVPVLTLLGTMTPARAQAPRASPTSQPSQTPKYGGMLVTHPLAATPSLSPHEEWAERGPRMSTTRLGRA